MNFFLDENFPKPVAKILESRGHRVFDIRLTEQEGASDVDIFKMAQKNNAIFLTTDKDFFHTIPYLFEHHHGIIVIILRQPNRRDIINKLLFALDNLDFKNIESKVIFLRDNDYTII